MNILCLLVQLNFLLLRIPLVGLHLVVTQTKRTHLVGTGKLDFQMPSALGRNVSTAATFKEPTAETLTRKGSVESSDQKNEILQH